MLESLVIIIICLVALAIFNHQQLKNKG